MDNDNDGITNLENFPITQIQIQMIRTEIVFSMLMIIWASQNSSISATDALVLEDADSDGVKDSDAYGCVQTLY